MGYFAGFQRRVFPCSHTSQIKEIPQIFPGQRDLSVHCPSFRPGHSSIGVYQSSQGSETHGTNKGYQNPPVPRQLVSQSPVRGNLLQHTQTLLALCRELDWVVNMKKSELTPQQDFNFIGYQFDLLTGRVLRTQERWSTLQES